MVSLSFSIKNWKVLSLSFLVFFSLIPALRLIVFQSHQSEHHTKVAAVKATLAKEEESDEEGGEEDDEQGGALCGFCGANDGPDEFWICCDMCEKWFHGKCVRITPAKADNIKHYKCPGCSGKRARA